MTSLLIIYQSSFANYSSKHLRYVTLFRGRIAPPADKNDTFWLNLQMNKMQKVQNVLLLMFVSAHQQDAAHWEKMKVEQLLSQKVQQSISAKLLSYLSWTEVKSVANKIANREKLEKISRDIRSLHSKLYKAAAAM